MSKYDITVNGRKYVVEVTAHQEHTQDGAYEVKVGAGVMQTAASMPAQTVPAQSRPEPAAAPATANASAPSTPAAPAAPAVQAPKAAAGGKPVTAPLPGVILQICVSEGQEVSQGQKLAVLEAMKMENDIVADRAGVVTSIAVQRGDSVLEDATIMTIG